jgi:hypothetical protein
VIKNYDILLTRFYTISSQITNTFVLTKPSGNAVSEKMHAEHEVASKGLKANDAHVPKTTLPVGWGHVAGLLWDSFFRPLPRETPKNEESH